MDNLFTFDDLMRVDDRGIQALLKEVQSESLVIALKGAKPELRERVMKNMSTRAAETLKEELDARGPVRVAEVEAEQKELLKVVRRLAEEGQLVIGGGSGDDFPTARMRGFCGPIRRRPVHAADATRCAERVYSRFIRARAELVRVVVVRDRYGQRPGARASRGAGDPAELHSAAAARGAAQSGYQDGYATAVALEGFKQSFAMPEHGAVGLVASVGEQLDTLPQEMARRLPAAPPRSRAGRAQRARRHPTRTPRSPRQAIDAVLLSARHIVHCAPPTNSRYRRSGRAMPRRASRVGRDEQIARGGCLVDSDIGLSTRHRERWRAPRRRSAASSACRRPIGPSAMQDPAMPDVQRPFAAQDDKRSASGSSGGATSPTFRQRPPSRCRSRRKAGSCASPASSSKPRESASRSARCARSTRTAAPPTRRRR